VTVAAAISTRPPHNVHSVELKLVTTTDSPDSPVCRPVAPFAVNQLSMTLAENALASSAEIVSEAVWLNACGTKA